MNAGEQPGFYMVQTGVFRTRELADRQLERLKSQGYPGFLVAKTDCFMCGRARSVNWTMQSAWSRN